MRSDRMAALAALLLVPVLAVAAAAADAAPDTTRTMPADLTGVWNLDEMASDDLAGQLEALQEALKARANAQRPDAGFGGEDTPVGKPGGRGMGRPPGRGGGDAPSDDGPRDLARAMKQLLITVDGADVEIMDGTDHTRIWTPGGQPVQRQGPGGEVIEQAWWEGPVLVLSTSGGSLVTTRRLHLEDGGKTLVADVTVKLSGSSERVNARVVYKGY